MSNMANDTSTASRQAEIKKAIQKYKEEQVKRRLEKVKDLTPKKSPTSSGGGSSGENMSYAIPTDRTVKVIKDKGGGVVGYEDPVSKTSVMFNESAVRESDIRQAEQTRYTEIIKAERENVRKKTTQEKELAEFRQGTLTAATEKEIKAMKTQQNPALKQVTGVVRSAGRAFRDPTDRFNPEQEEGGELAIFGAQLGLIGRSAVEGITTATGIKGAQAGSAALNKALNIGQKSKVLAFGTNIAGATAVGVGVQKTDAELQKQLNTIGLQRPDIDKELLKEASAAGRRAEGAAQNTFLKQVGFGLGLRGDRAAFEKGATDYLRQAGISGNIETAVPFLEGERRGLQSSLMKGTLAIGAFSERAGSQALKKGITTLPKSQALGKNFGKDFLFSAIRIGAAGAGEGYAQTIITQKTTGDTRDFFELTPRRFEFEIPQALKERRPDLKDAGIDFKTSRFTEALIGAGAGTVTAGALGGGIFALGVRGSTIRRGGLETIGNVLDPSEAPSDFLEKIITPSAKTPKTPKTPRARVKTITPSFTETTGLSFTPTQTKQLTPAISKTKTITPSFTETTGLSFTPTQTKQLSITPTPVDTFGTTPVDIPTLTETPANVPTNIPSNVPVNVPVFTDKIGAGVPSLPFWNLGSGGATGGGRKARVGFVDELTASTAIFKQSLGFRNLQTPKPKKDKQPKYIIKGNKAYRVATSGTGGKKTTSKGQPRQQGFQGFYKRAFG